MFPIAYHAANLFSTQDNNDEAEATTQLISLDTINLSIIPQTTIQRGGLKGTGSNLNAVSSFVTEISQNQMKMMKMLDCIQLAIQSNTSVSSPFSKADVPKNTTSMNAANSTTQPTHVVDNTTSNHVVKLATSTIQNTMSTTSANVPTMSNAKVPKESELQPTRATKRINVVDSSQSFEIDIEQITKKRKSNKRKSIAMAKRD